MIAGVCSDVGVWSHGTEQQERRKEAVGPMLANRGPRRRLLQQQREDVGPGIGRTRRLRRKVPGEGLDPGIGQQTSDPEQAIEDHILRRHSLIFPPDHIKRRGGLAEF